MIKMDYSPGRHSELGSRKLNKGVVGNAKCVLQYSY